MKENGVPDKDMEKLIKESAEFANAGKTSVYFEKGGKLLGVLALADSVRADSVDAIREFKEMGIRTVMLTGDRKKTADAIAAEVGVDEVVAEVLPGGKEEVIRGLMEQGRTAMVGDGINDAPALTRANVGIAIGAGTDVAIDAADVVLVNSSLSDAAKAVRLGRKTLKNIHENLFWAFFYNAICIPVAAGAYIKLFGWALNPMLGAAAMSLSSFCVVTNALRLNLFDAGDRKNAAAGNNNSPTQTAASADAPENNNDESEENLMQKTMKIEGMMCTHCEAAVKKALEALDGVEAAEVSHEAGTAVVSMSADVADAALKEAVEAKDYKVLGIE
jgi:Cu2+-exporting ATPase